MSSSLTEPAHPAAELSQLMRAFAESTGLPYTETVERGRLSSVMAPPILELDTFGSDPTSRRYVRMTISSGWVEVPE